MSSEQIMPDGTYAPSGSYTNEPSGNLSYDSKMSWMDKFRHFMFFKDSVFIVVVMTVILIVLLVLVIVYGVKYEKLRKQSNIPVGEAYMPW